MVALTEQTEKLLGEKVESGGYGTTDVLPFP